VHQSIPTCRILLRGVIIQAQSGLSETCSEHVRVSLLGGFGQAHSCLVLAEHGIGFVGVPGRMADFKGESECLRAKSKKVLEQRTVEFEIGRQLNEDWPEVVSVV